MAADDCGAPGLSEGDLVRVSSRRGVIEVPVRIGGIRPGSVFAPFHYGYWDAGGAPGEHPTAAAAVSRRHRSRRPAMNLRIYLGLLRRTELTLAESFVEGAEGHGGEPDVYFHCLTLARQCLDPNGCTSSGSP